MSATGYLKDREFWAGFLPMAAWAAGILVAESGVAFVESIGGFLLVLLAGMFGFLLLGVRVYRWAEE